MHEGVRLITYADRFGGGDLSTIRDLLTGPLAGVFTGVHILPFYTPFDGVDAGFDPIDHQIVDPRLGDWSSVRAIAETHEVTADLIVNHISVDSPQFADFKAKGDRSEYAGMFLEAESVFPDGISDRDLETIYRPRPTSPFTEMLMADGTRRSMWTTFTPSQIDLDVNHPRARSYLLEILDLMADSGVSRVRLDAIGYAIKTPGTSCFMTPDTFDFVHDIEAAVRERGMTSLLEIHSHYSEQIRVARTSDRVYDFALPPLVLYGLYTGSVTPLRDWLRLSPRNAVTVLDTHDGIGVIDVGPEGARDGLLSPDQLGIVVEGIHQASEGESRLATGSAASNLDLYQVNCTYFSALGGNENAYLLARLIQMLSPGTPQIYYAGLLAASNDMDLLAETGVGRDINRPYFTLAEVDEGLNEPVVKRMLALARFRNRHPAFDGEFSVGTGDDTRLELGWDAETSHIHASIDLAAATFSIEDDDATITDWDQF